MSQLLELKQLSTFVSDFCILRSMEGEQTREIQQPTGITLHWVDNEKWDITQPGTVDYTQFQHSLTDYFGKITKDQLGNHEIFRGVQAMDIQLINEGYDQGIFLITTDTKRDMIFTVAKNTELGNKQTAYDHETLPKLKQRLLEQNAEDEVIIPERFSNLLKIPSGENQVLFGECVELVENVVEISAKHESSPPFQRLFANIYSLDKLAKARHVEPLKLTPEQESLVTETSYRELAKIQTITNLFIHTDIPNPINNGTFITIPPGTDKPRFGITTLRIPHSDEKPLGNFLTDLLTYTEPSLEKSFIAEGQLVQPYAEEPDSVLDGFLSALTITGNENQLKTALEETKRNIDDRDSEDGKRFIHESLWEKSLTAVLNRLQSLS